MDNNSPKKENKKRISLNKSDIIVYAIVGALSALAFVSIYGVKVINPGYVDWLLSGGDISQHYLGWVAYRFGAWKFPIGFFDTLSYPNNASIIFTDSIPIVAFFFKILSPILPKTFQYFGLWGVLCFILQGILSARIIKNFTKNKAAIIIFGVIFAFTPVMIRRMFAHTALAGQWLLFIPLEILFAPEKYKDNKKIYILIGLTGLLSGSVHMYYLLMNGMILVGICLYDLLANKRIVRSIILLGEFLLTGAGATALFGGFGSNMKAQIWGLGYFSFNLNSFFNPMGWSRVFKDLKMYSPGQAEGFAFIGAGFILLLAFAIVMFFVSGKPFEKVKKYRFHIIAIAFVCLCTLIVSLSPTVTIGEKVLLDLHLPAKIFDLWSVFRSSGRLCWNVVYIIMFLAGIVAVKCTKKQYLLIAALVIMSALQIFDMSKVYKAKFKEFNKKRTYVSTLTEDIWDAVGSDEEIKYVVYGYVLPDTDDRTFLFDLTDWGLNNGKTLNNYYFARSIEEEAAVVRNSTLASPDKEHIFIFDKQTLPESGEYNLHYYETKGCVIGYVNVISGFEEADISKLKSIYEIENVE